MCFKYYINKNNNTCNFNKSLYMYTDNRISYTCTINFFFFNGNQLSFFFNLK